mgnify:FL=1
MNKKILIVIGYIMSFTLTIIGLSIGLYLIIRHKQITQMTNNNKIKLHAIAIIIISFLFSIIYKNFMKIGF